MVPADSRRIPRAPRYSGYRYGSDNFEYATIMLYGWTFQNILLIIFRPTSRSYNPIHAVTWMVWAIPRSLATTGGIIVIFFSCRYEDVSVPCVSSLLGKVISLQLIGLSHSEILGSKIICISPRLIAAYHVLHRLREPRHPPCALSYFHLSIHTIASAGDIYFQLVLKILLFALFNMS